MIKIASLQIFNIEEIAIQFKLTPATVRRYIKLGRLKGQKMGTKWYVSNEAISDFFMSPYFSPKKKDKNIEGEK